MGRRYNNDSVRSTAVSVSRTRNKLIRVAFEANVGPVGKSNLHTLNCSIRLIMPQWLFLVTAVNLLSVTPPCYVHLGNRLAVRENTYSSKDPS